MAHRSKKNFICNDCESETFFEFSKDMIAHYRKKHKNNPEGLYDAIGETWNPIYDRLIESARFAAKAEREAEIREEQLRTELAQHIANFDRIAAKWNAIVLIVSGPANK